MVVSHRAKFRLISTTGSRFFRTVFVEILRPPLLALVPEAGLRISGSDVRGSPQTESGFIRLLAAGNVTIAEVRFRANCLLYGLEIFVAATVMKGITCVVQCYNNKSNHRAGISLHQSLSSGPAMEKWIVFVLTHSANFNLRGIFVSCSDHFTDRVFAEGCSCRRILEVDCIVHSNYMERKIRKKRDERHLILTQLKL